MAPNPDTFRCSYQLAYEAEPDAFLDADVLACVRFGNHLQAQSDPRDIRVDLPQAGVLPAPLAEVWRSRRPLVQGWDQGLGYAHNGEVLFGHLRVPAAELDDLEAATVSGYLRIEALLSRLAYPCALRLWNFLPHINRGDGDAERYRQFTQGRYKVLSRSSGFEGGLAAATAIGTQGRDMTLCFLAAREPGVQVENPRQVSAFRYPADYGPSSPSFSRAHLKHWADGLHLFLSGTASVVGHRSLHPGDAAAQLAETHRNIEALLQQAARAKPAAGAFSAAALKIFVRHAEDLPMLRLQARALFGRDVPLLWLIGDICRSDLLLEVEGLYTASPRAVA